MVAYEKPLSRLEILAMKAPMMMGNKTELTATVCATILRLGHELAREWICLQAAVAFLTRTALATAAILRGV